MNEKKSNGTVVAVFNALPIDSIRLTRDYGKLYDKNWNLTK